MSNVVRGWLLVDHSVFVVVVVDRWNGGGCSCDGGRSVWGCRRGALVKTTVKCNMPCRMWSTIMNRESIWNIKNIFVYTCGWSDWKISLSFFALWFIHVFFASFCRWKSLQWLIKAPVLHHGIGEEDSSTSLQLSALIVLFLSCCHTKLSLVL